MPTTASVLVVDDDKDVADSTADVLSLYGFAATPAYSAEQAIRSALACPPDAVVSDLKMSTDGCELARRLVAALARRPLLVAVTGVQGADDLCRTAGFDHVFLKPADPSVLAKLLSQGS
jgi:CheY-like chemotaxis protein